ncbi:MAG: methyltransferase domain-containing protein [Nevskia sp.]|nr:methyltransferase domain-containing protein [Nevskia sp.]
MSSKEPIYRQAGLPVFQNKAYPTPAAARLAPIGDVELVQCPRSGLVYNARFDEALLQYDEHYQNEQACSPSFKRHLEEVRGIVLANIKAGQKGIEIGCGKGYFLEMLAEAGADVMGYDPAYEGASARVVKQYFGAEAVAEAPDYVVLRHVLEHIASPWSFLQQLAAKCGAGTRIYIEVPCFDWIVENNAFYDVFYEHVNYFTLDVLRHVFSRVIQSGRLFGGQYLYIVAELAGFGPPSAYSGREFEKLKLEDYLSELVARRKDPGNGFFIWGAGAKGITFANILARKGLDVAALIDINPAKQGKYAGLSAASIVAPESVLDQLGGRDVFVMNPVYLDEIKSMCGETGVNWISVV